MAVVSYDVIIVGAGAAGLMAVQVAGQRGKRVLLLDHAPQVGSKILISGGGRCNFTNRDAKPECYYSANPSFCISALRRYSAANFIALVEKHQIAYHEKKLGQLFCDGSAQAIVAMLLAECAAGQVVVQCDEAITSLRHQTDFIVETGRGSYQAPCLVVATGGCSIPKMGATGFAYDVARQFDIPLVATRPALVPLRFDGALGAMMQELSGVSLPAVAQRQKRQFAENILFTHRGLSGPAILQISSLWREGEAITLNLLPEHDVLAFLLAAKAARPKAALRAVLADFFPQRLAQKLTEPPFLAVPNELPIGQWRDRDLAALAVRLQAWEVVPCGTEGYAKAEVTLGGIDTRALSSQSMAVRNVPGLFFIGEAVDVTGWLGGYNFQWAWSSGWCAGMAV